MQRQFAALLAACVVAAVVLVGGCSGAGVPVADVRGDDVRAEAGDHLSAVTLLKGWLNIIHVRVEVPLAGVQTSDLCEPTLDMEFFEDGSMRMWGTNTDCSQFDYTMQVDESGAGTLTWPNGDVMNLQWGPSIWDGDLLSQDVSDTYPDGTQLQYTVAVDFGAPETPQQWDGTATLPDGRAMDFTFDRAIGGADHLLLQLPDGATLEVDIPTAPVEGAVFWPLFDPGGVGSYRSATGRRLDFTITGANDRWNRWVFASTVGTQGDFALDEQFAGIGQLTRNGDVLGALRWPETGTGTLDLVGATTWTVTPSAAARDFQVDRWVSNVAALGPMPMY